MSGVAGEAASAETWSRSLDNLTMHVRWSGQASRF